MTTEPTRDELADALRKLVSRWEAGARLASQLSVSDAAIEAISEQLRECAEQVREIFGDPKDTKETP